MVPSNEFAMALVATFPSGEAGTLPRALNVGRSSWATTTF
jgi:hypothetical protein